jgi:phosphoribosylformylglycinamidine synthase
VATGPASSSSKSGERTVLQLFRRPFLSEEAAATLTRKANLKPGVDGGIASVTTEQCFNVETTEPLTSEEMTTLQWLLRETFEPELFTEASAFADASSVVEVGPRLAFQSAWSTNAVGVCKNCGLEKVTRLERSRRFLVTMKDGSALTDPVKLAFASIVHDRMTECVYDEPLATFATDASPEEVYTVPVLARAAPRSSAWTKRWASRSTRRTSTTTSLCSGTTSGATPRTWSCSTWGRATRNTRGTGSSAGTSSWTAFRSPSRCSRW